MKYSRVATAAILLPVFILFTLYAPAVVFATLFAVLAGVCFNEYSTMAENRGIKVFRFRGFLASFVLPLSFIHTAPVVYILLVLILASIITGGLAAEGEREGVESAAFTTFGVFYIGLAFSSALLIRSMPDGPLLFLLICVATWGADIGAYYTGRSLGKTKLAPSISPNKTVEGFIGGVVLGILFSLVFFIVFFRSTDPVTVLAAGLIGGFIGPVGDMAESKLKRYFGVKDSGTILPGHGGLLDRADAMMFSIPFFYIFLALKGGLF